MRGEFETPLLLPLPAQGGRLLEFIRVVCEVPGRFELPKPCGARPESVELPCAFQARPEACGREALLLKEPLGRADCDCPADGGRFDESCDCREPLKVCALFPPRPKFPAGLLPRLAEKEPEFIVRTGMCEAAAAGVERATTLRF